MFSCDGEEGNDGGHAVIMVGWGEEGGVKYIKLAKLEGTDFSVQLRVGKAVGIEVGVVTGVQVRIKREMHLPCGCLFFTRSCARASGWREAQI